MKLVLRHTITLFLCLFTQLSAENFEAHFAKQTGLFLDSLDATQSKQCLLANDDPLRWKMQYTGGKRAGLEISKLNDKQRTLFESTIKLVLSNEGWEMANKVAKQDGEIGLGKYFVACFGDPRKKEGFAFRLAEHHLTIVNFSVAEGTLNEFGPILLGANPPELWKKDEEALLKLWQTINDPAVLVKNKKAIASKAMAEDQGVDFSELNPKAQAQLAQTWKQRLSIFTPAMRQKIETLHNSRGGLKKSRIAFYNEPPTKRCTDGGKWDFKCGLPGMVWDYEGSRGHIHLSLWIKPN